jgi:hypothetical protein
MRVKKKGRKEMNVDVSMIGQREPGSVGSMTRPPGMMGCPDGQNDQETQFMAMIVCSGCKHMVYSPVEYFECKNLANGGMISRHCHRCEAATSWVQFEWHRPDRDKPLLYQTTQPDRI